MEEKNKKDIEDAYTKAIGEIGKWQMFIFAMVAIPSKVVLPSIHFGIIYMAPKTTFWCLERMNGSEVLNMTCYSDCKDYEYESIIENTIIKQWDLICDKAWLADFSQTICMFGVLIGSLVFGNISDRYGRRWSLIYAGSLEASMSFALSFCPNYWSFLIVRFFLGCATGGTMLCSIVILMEIIGPNKREFMGCVYVLPLVIGSSLLTAIAYYTKSWRGFTVGFSIPTLIYLTYVFWLPESPKWLISVGRLDEAYTVMTTASKWNNLPTNDMKEIIESIAKEGSTQKPRKQATFKDLIIQPNLRIKNLCSCLMWFSTGLTFYGSHQYFGQTSSNVFLAFGLTGIAELPGFLIGAYMSKVLGRRVAIISFFILSGVGNGILVLPDDWYYLKLIAGIIGVSSGGAVLSLQYIYTSELFPTVARNMGIGVSSTANRVGSMLAPFVGGLRVQAPYIPPVVFAVAPVIGVGACLCLPETRGKKLEDHLEES